MSRTALAPACTLVGAIAAELVRVTRLIRREQEHEAEKTGDVFRNEFAT